MLVVTSTYNDSYQNVLNFANANKLDLIVYNKNDRYEIGQENKTYITDKLTIIDIPNYGRCDYAFLYYIITNYHKLPDKVLFTKANFMDQNIRLEYALYCNYFMNIGKHIKYGILNPDFDKNILYNKGVHKNDTEDLLRNKKTYIDPNFQSYLTNDFYQIIYGDKPPPDDYIIQFGHGPCFCVAKEAILNHPLSVYQKLLDTFYPNKNHWTNWEGHSTEEINIQIGKRYHDNLQRFWTLLFVPNYKNENVETDYENFVKINA